MNKEQTKQNQIKNMRSWIGPKEVQVHNYKQSIELQKLAMKQSKENVKDGWFIKEKKKAILEAESDFTRKLAEFDLKAFEADIKNGFIGQIDQIKLEELELKLSVEEKQLKEMQKQITMLERNGKIEDVRNAQAPNDKDKNVDLGFGRKK